VEPKPSIETETTANQIELSRLDLRFEGFRMKNRGLEEKLLASIAERGIEEPLEGVQVGSVPILLNGFKRRRCALRLQIQRVPYACLGGDEVSGIINLLRLSNTRALSLLEQARFIDELKNVQAMTVAQIAADLSRSKAWVSMRLGLMSEMTPILREKLFAGSFPVYSYMYTLRQFMRMNGVKREQIEQFVEAVGGKNLSVREVEQLAHGFFRGPESFRQEILKGNLALPLQRLRELPADPDGCSEFERVLIHDLEVLQKYMQRTMGKAQDPRLQSRAFYAQCHLLAGGILSRAHAFLQSLRQLHDRSGQA
jgi:predicted transcriptional regulator